MVAGIAALSVTIAGAQTDDTARGTDPLSVEETETALGLARGSNPGEALGLGDDDVVLLVERHEENKDVEDDDLRRADVYVYSYDDDVLTLSVVDVATGEVDQSRVVPNTQLPLVPEESERAMDLALADTATRAGPGHGLPPVHGPGPHRPGHRARGAAHHLPGRRQPRHPGRGHRRAGATAAPSS